MIKHNNYLTFTDALQPLLLLWYPIPMPGSNIYIEII